MKNVDKFDVVSVYNHLNETYIVEEVKNGKAVLNNVDGKGKSRTVKLGTIVSAKDTMAYNIGDAVNVRYNELKSMIITGYTVDKENERAYVLDYVAMPYYDNELDLTHKKGTFNWEHGNKNNDTHWEFYINAKNWKRAYEPKKGIRGRYYVVFDEVLGEWHPMLNTRKYTVTPGAIYFANIKIAQDFSDHLNSINFKLREKW